MDCLQVYVKTSAFFRISKKAYPFRDAQQLVRELISAYGAHRLMLICVRHRLAVGGGRMWVRCRILCRASASFLSVPYVSSHSWATH